MYFRIVYNDIIQWLSIYKDAKTNLHNSSVPRIIKSTRSLDTNKRERAKKIHNCLFFSETYFHSLRNFATMSASRKMVYSLWSISILVPPYSGKTTLSPTATDIGMCSPLSLRAPENKLLLVFQSTLSETCETQYYGGIPKHLHP